VLGAEKMAPARAQGEVNAARRQRIESQTALELSCFRVDRLIGLDPLPNGGVRPPLFCGAKLWGGPPTRSRHLFAGEDAARGGTKK
jgi:hypothetical protein